MGVALMLAASAAGAQTPPPSTQTCVDVRVGSEQAYDCINAGFARTVQQAHTPIDPGTLSATSPAPKVGTFNQTATSERMGNTFGHSAFSQRPPKPVFVDPLTTRAAR